MRVALVLPPLCQLNTPYPSTAYLTRFLTEQGVDCRQHDLGMGLFLRLMGAPGLTEVFLAIEERAESGLGLPEPAWHALAHQRAHVRAIDRVVAFLQGRDRTLGPGLLSGALLPHTPRQARFDPAFFGQAGSQDAARHRCTLYLADIADLVAATIDPGFGLSRYQHHLAVGPVGFGDLAARLAGTTLLDAWLDTLVDQLIEGPGGPPDLLGVSVPFPGTLYGGLRIASRARAAGVPTVMGGGYVNTELRQVAEDRLWEHVDALCYDDGEGPLLALLEHMSGAGDRRHRTRTRDGLHTARAPRPTVLPVAQYTGLPLGDYLSLLDTLNPAHRLWADGRWNKATLAHGCYWKRCAFCDVELDYIARYAPSPVAPLVDALDQVAAETGTRGFHLVDEAAPPRLLRDLALELLDRGSPRPFWGNIRFEPSFTPDLCRLLSAAGMVCVTGGLEVASDRLLGLMDKGITVAQAARACQAFSQAGIMVHAYLMYGFPTQTAEETIDSMEVVRQLFEAGLLTSAFWHRFVLTRHSGVHGAPERFGVQFAPPTGVFAQNDIPHQDPSGADHDRFDQGLARSLGAWLRGQSLGRPVQDWFDEDCPRPSVPPAWVQGQLGRDLPPIGAQQRLVWLGPDPLESEGGLSLHTRTGAVDVPAGGPVLDWFFEVIEAARPGQEPLRMADAQAAFPGDWAAHADTWGRLRRVGMVGV